MKSSAERENVALHSGERPIWAQRGEAALEGYFARSSDIILIVDGQGQIVEANPAIEKVLGYQVDAVRGQPIGLLVPERFTQHTTHVSQFFAKPETRPMGEGLELYARHADGSNVPVDISLTPIAESAGVGVVCLLRDLRGKLHASDTLRVQATALRSAASGVVITDKKGFIVWVNPAACQLTGYAPHELVGQHTRLLKSGEHDAAFYSGLWETVSRGESWSGTIINRRKDGQRYHEEQTIAPVVDDAGEVTHFIAIKQDVTLERKLQQELSSAKEELAKRLEEIEALNRKLHEEAIRDPLTGLHNRRYLEEALLHLVARSDRTGEFLSIAVIDVDHFKQINDEHGHAMGDRVLVRLGGLLREQTRQSDLICRFGGEEFVVIMPGAAHEHALARAEQLRRTVSETTGATQEPGIHVAVSVGVAVYRTGRESVNETIARADGALYEAKNAGRNQVRSAEDG